MVRTDHDATQAPTPREEAGLVFIKPGLPKPPLRAHAAAASRAPLLLRRQSSLLLDHASVTVAVTTTALA